MARLVRCAIERGPIMLPKLIQPPALEPVSVAEARQWLRDDSLEEDQIIQTLIVSARMTLESYTRRFMIEQRWRLMFDLWPASVAFEQRLEIPFTPCGAIDAIHVYDGADNPCPLDAASFRLSTSSDNPRLLFLSQPPAPGRNYEGIEIDITAGYGAQPNDTPAPLRRALLMLVAAWRENRGDLPETTLPGSGLPENVLRLVAPFRRERLI